MADTVVLDGSGIVTVQGTASVRVIASDAGGMVTVVDDVSQDLTVQADGNADLIIQQDGEYGQMTVIHSGDLPYYTGATEVTPSLEAQTLATADKALASNIVINPIPSNYGLITWDGSTITVS